MILIEGKKFACDTCIKGHRSSACKHTDRPLFEIQKKGRPITQCSHCRELRKTKQVHVKCQCGESKAGKEETLAGTVNSLKKTPEAVFPAGVSTAIVLIPDPSSDSDQPICNCKTDGQCHCAVPRKIKRTRQKNSTGVTIPPTALSPTATRPHPDSTHEYRPVLPKPPQTQNVHSHDGPVHVPSSTPTYGHVPRHHAHPEMLYSPYGRAYENAHSYDRPYETDPVSVNFPGIENMAEADNIIVTHPDGQSISWNIFNAAGRSLEALCGCGESCACPGCFEHRGSTAAVQALLEMSSSSGCVNPSTCTSCVECSIIIGPSLETSPTEMQNVDEWFRQLTAPPPPSSGCNCPPGLCACTTDCYGCCQDRGGEGHQHAEREPITFAVSGERAPCCNGRMEDGSLTDTRGMFLSLQSSSRSSSDVSSGGQSSRVWDGDMTNIF